MSDLISAEIKNAMRQLRAHERVMVPKRRMLLREARDPRHSLFNAAKSVAARFRPFRVHA